jgi:hypothetical protein
MKRRIFFLPAGFVGFDVRLPRFAASSSSGWRRTPSGFARGHARFLAGAEVLAAAFFAAALSAAA